MLNDLHLENSDPDLKEFDTLLEAKDFYSYNKN